MTDFTHLPYRPCVGIALFNKSGLVFTGQRLDRPGAWQMPQGGIDEGEDIKTAFYREMLEEIGTDNAEILEISHPPIRYDLPDDLMGKLWGGQYRGQEQTWVAAKYLGEDSDINLEAHLPAEFSAWRWTRLETLLDDAGFVPFKKQVYVEIMQRFKKYAAE